MSVSSPGRPFHRAGIVAQADVTRRGTYRAREREEERPCHLGLVQIIDLSGRLAPFRPTTLNDLLTMADLNSNRTLHWLDRHRAGSWRFLLATHHRPQHG